MIESMNWINNYRLHRIGQDFGGNALKESSASTRQSCADQIWFHPYTEWVSMGIISLSTCSTFVQMAIEHNQSVSWMTAHRTQMSLFNWVDLFITLFLLWELAFKIILAPRK